MYKGIRELVGSRFKSKLSKLLKEKKFLMKAYLLLTASTYFDTKQSLKTVIIYKWLDSNAPQLQLVRKDH